jgi:hypothetical protein
MRWIVDPKTGDLVEPAEYYARQTAARSDLPFPMVISDQIELQGQHDGKIYTSKALLRRSYREQGYVEVGNEWLNKEFSKPKPKVDRKAIRESVAKAKARVGI